MSSAISHKHRTFLKTFFDEYEWIHLTLGLVGNTLFFIGSVMFLNKSLMTLGTWLFIVGSFLMLFGSAGNTLVKYVNSKSHKENR